MNYIPAFLTKNINGGKMGDFLKFLKDRSSWEIAAYALLGIILTIGLNTNYEKLTLGKVLLFSSVGMVFVLHIHFLTQMKRFTYLIILEFACFFAFIYGVDERSLISALKGMASGGLLGGLILYLETQKFKVE